MEPQEGNEQDKPYTPGGWEIAGTVLGIVGGQVGNLVLPSERFTFWCGNIVLGAVLGYTAGMVISELSLLRKKH
jgi:hypothetical protein